MRLNEMQPAPGSRKTAKRVGRGIGSGLGKTCGRGHKGQHSRAGRTHRPGFEGGQMPLHRRMPKFGFHAWKKHATAEIRLHELTLVEGAIVDFAALEKANLINTNTQFARIILSGEINRAVTVKGIAVTKGAKAAIEAAGGKVE